MTAIQEIHETTSAGITVTPVAGHIGADAPPESYPEIFTVGPDGRESELIAGHPFTTKHTVVVAD
jgi:hypothetical protein